MSRLLQRWAVLTAAMLVAVLAIPLAVAAQSTPKTYVAEVTPAEVPAGATETFTLTIQNTSDQQQLGSANLTAPEGFSLVKLVAIQPRGDATIVGDTLQLRDLSLAPGTPGETLTVAFTAAAPCSAGERSWDLLAKQANNFNGPPGNHFTRVPDSVLSVTVAGGCRLMFLDQPSHAEFAGAKEKTPISGVPFGDPTQDPVRVAFVDEAEQVLTSATGAITLGLGNDGSPGTNATLDGSLTQQASDGVAAFGDLTLDQIGHAYTLVASAEGAEDLASEPFSVWESVTTCSSAQTCTTEVTRENSVAAKLEGTASSQGGHAVASIGVLSPEDGRLEGCVGDGNHAPEVVTVDGIGLEGEKVVTLTIAKEAVMQEVNNGAAHYEVCFLGEGETEAQTLRSCTIDVPPCVASKNKTGQGDVVLTVRLPAGDPHIW